MILALVRHAESVENATKTTGFYQDPRPWSGRAAHALSRDIVGLTPRGFRQALWLAATLPQLLGPSPCVYTSPYRRAVDTAEIAFPTSPAGRPNVTALLSEQHYADATYMTKRELFATYPAGADDRRSRKHLWTPPGHGGEALTGGVLERAEAFITSITEQPDRPRAVVAVSHHTTILALRAILERRPVTDLVDEARIRKTPNAGVLRYEFHDATFRSLGIVEPAL